MVFGYLSQCRVGAAHAPGRVPALTPLPEGQLQNPPGDARGSRQPKPKGASGSNCSCGSSRQTPAEPWESSGQARRPSAPTSGASTRLSALGVLC